MPTSTPIARIGVCGGEARRPNQKSAWSLWPTGYPGSLTAAGAEPVPLNISGRGQSWGTLLNEIHGVVLAGADDDPVSRIAAEEDLCKTCKAKGLPILAIDHGLHTLNGVFGGTTYFDLPRELPEALQHRHPPEPGLRHMIDVVPDTRLAAVYGEGEIIVNSEHRRAVQRVARGFKVSARALDGVVEALEWDQDGWFAVGVQWHPASASASGLDIQLFRALVTAAQEGMARTKSRRRRVLSRVA